MQQTYAGTSQDVAYFIKTPNKDELVSGMEESLRDMLKHGRKFERLRIDESGIFVRKIPQSKEEPAYLA
ncbi:MAG: hypothetical protein ACXAEJ_15025, partial [Candidatus Thorarchaeota archaeon]